MTTIRDPQQATGLSTPKERPPAAHNQPPATVATKSRSELPGVQLSDGHRLCEAQTRPAVGTALADSQLTSDTQVTCAVGTQLPPAMNDAVPMTEAPGESKLTSSQSRTEPQNGHAAGDQTSDSQRVDDSHTSIAVGPASPDGHTCIDFHRSITVRGPILADPVLGLLADAVGDLEMVRVANENRLRTLTATDEYGHGLSLENKPVAKLAAIVEALKDSEHQAILGLQRSMREHPLGPWVKAQGGVGEKQAARLLAVIRDPYWNDLHDRPRTVSELWAYCGFHVLPGGHVSNETHNGSAAGSNVHTSSQKIAAAHDHGAAGVAPKRQRGQKSNWNEDARKRVWLIAASCVKQSAEKSEYRRIYDEGRAKYADAVHPAVCVRCGPKGKPALAGSPLSPGHQHARAMRLIAKAVLKDMWLEAKRIHEESK